MCHGAAPEIIAFSGQTPAAQTNRREGHQAKLEHDPDDLASSDSLPVNISPRARWVVCPLGRTRGHGRRFIYPEKKVRRFHVAMTVSPGAAWPLGQQREEQDCSFFRSLCSPYSGRRRNSIFIYVPIHLAFHSSIRKCCNNNTSSTIHASSLHFSTMKKRWDYRTVRRFE